MMTRSQWLIKDKDKDKEGKPTEVRHHGTEVHRKNAGWHMGDLYRSSIRC
jgi:hypothetical protein